MLARIIIKAFGSVWNAKRLCVEGNTLVRKIAKAVYDAYQYENNSSVAWNSKFAGEPTFPHGMKCIFISGGAKIGKNCIIFQQVTIGSISLLDAKGRGAPTIGDNVYIGAGAKIIGSVEVGNNVRIGANAVVHRNVPDNSVVVSGEQKVIAKDSTLDNRFYTYRDGWGYIENGRWEKIKDPEILERLI